MKKHVLVGLAFISFLMIGCTLKSKNDSADLMVTSLRIDYAVNPTGIDNLSPVMSWEITSAEKGFKQAGYSILVASSPEKLKSNTADLWESDQVLSDESIGIIYGGKALSSGQSCFWKVKVWDEKGSESDWSEQAYWSMGLLKAEDWKAGWIGLDKAVGKDDTASEFTRLSARMFRKEIEIKQKVKRATAYICGLGVFEWYINGNKIGTQVLAPALSEYNKRSYYMTFDVTSELKKGQNALGVILGNGRYFAPRKMEPMATETYGFPKMIFQLEVEYKDGTRETFVSDNTWKLTTDGPIIANNEYDGEEYDATKEIAGWNKPGFDDSNWMEPELVVPGSPVLSAQPNAPIAVMETLKPISVKEVKPGIFVFDMGQNMVGWTTLKVQGNRGTKVTMRFSETLQPDGSLYLANIRSARVTDTYTLKGEGIEVFEPLFVYHGFRFVEITGYPGRPDLSSIEGKVVYDNIPVTGSFETSNTTINTIYSNAYWGIRGNYRSIPTDCPQRDERQGWLGDRATGSKGESFIFDNSRLYAKWMQDIEDAQREDGCVPDVAPSYWRIYNEDVTWPAAYLIISGMLYDQYGDLTPIMTHYDSFKKYVDFIKSKYLKNGILIKDTYGDWCMPPESQELIHSKDPARRTSGEILSTTYYYNLLSLMQKFARLLNKNEDAVEYGQIAETIYKSYNKQFFNSKLNSYGNNTATANLLSLAYELVPDVNKKAVFENIVNKTMNEFQGHISTGLIGAQWINRILTQYGRPDIAFKLATNTDYPSYGYMIENGATTIWELWNGNTADPAMNSGNHVMLLGDLVIWFYENLAGIKSDPETPAFKHIIMKPTPLKDLDFVKASYKSVRGLIKSEWSKERSIFNWTIVIPANTTATIYVPAKSGDDVKEGNIALSGIEGVKFLRMEEGKALFEIASGSYNLTSSF